MPSRTAAGGTAIAVVLLVTLGLHLSGPAEAQEGRWVIAWGSSLQGLAPNRLTNATVQMIARPTIAGNHVRVKLENTFSAEPLTIGEAYVALRNYKVGLVAGSNRPLTFNGLPSVTLPAGGRVISDPVAFTVAARQDLAVSLYVPGANVPISQHTSAFTTSYLTPNGAGNHAASEDRRAFTVTTTAMYWLSAVEVFSSSAPGAIIAFGDSITDGACSTVDAHERWEDRLAERLLPLAGKGPAVVNAGIGGDTLTRAKLIPPPDSPSGTERLDRDVLEQAGVTHVILFMGTNDISKEVSAAQVMAGMQEIIARVKASGLKIIGVTIIPRTRWDGTKTAIRHEVNDWIRHQVGFDTVLDFDWVVRDAANPNVINPLFNCDGVHPNPFGYFVMGQSIDLEILLGLLAARPASGPAPPE
jgi:lysophospholipase L1-like esterase